MPLLSVAAQHILNTTHIVGDTVELASALTAATILANVAVTPNASEMTYNVSSGTLNHTQPTNCGADVLKATTAAELMTRRWYLCGLILVTLIDIGCCVCVVDTGA